MRPYTSPAFVNHFGDPGNGDSETITALCVLSDIWLSKCWRRLGMMKGTFSVPSYTRTVYPGRGRGRLPEEETQMCLPSPAVVLEPTVLGVGGCRWAVLLGRGRRVGGAWDRQGMRLKKGVPRYTGSGASGAERKSELSVT